MQIQKFIHPYILWGLIDTFGSLENTHWLFLLMTDQGDTILDQYVKKKWMILLENKNWD